MLFKGFVGNVQCILCSERVRPYDRLHASVLSLGPFTLLAYSTSLRADGIWKEWDIMGAFKHAVSLVGLHHVFLPCTRFTVNGVKVPRGASRARVENATVIRHQWKFTLQASGMRASWPAAESVRDNRLTPFTR